jgi:hypothetical protein
VVPSLAKDAMAVAKVPVVRWHGEILSIAVFEVPEEKKKEALAALRGLIKLLSQKKYSRDVLYRERSSQRYVDMRYWASIEARHEAQEDPEVHTFWARLGHLIKIEKIYETFERLGPSD